jgi:flagellar P-ring protein precursor FlgI
MRRIKKALRKALWLMAVAFPLILTAPVLGQARVKDLTDVEGVRANQLYGLGLVVGLDGTGGRSNFTRQLAVEMLKRLNFVTTTADFKSNTVAAVMVTAELPPFAAEGSRIDAIVSAIDDSTSLQGGTLLLTPLRGPDGEVYAVAQGPISVGGFLFAGQAAQAQKNHPTVGRIAGGALVERVVPTQLLHNGYVRLLLRQPDFQTAQQIARVINQRFPGAAQPLDAGTVQLAIPQPYLQNPVALLGDIGHLQVKPDIPARVVINERTGTIVAGEHVTISAVAVAHGNLAIVTSEEPQVSQPAPLSRGETTVVPRTRLEVNEQTGAIHLIGPAVTVADLARALNALGVNPRDIIAIFQAIKQAGALHAEIVVM